MPLAALAVVEHEPIATLEGLLERRQRMLGSPIELPQRRPDHLEGVVVEAEPYVQSVLLDASSLFAVAPARTLATESPAALVDGDLEALAQFGSGQLECRPDRRRPAAQYGNFRALRRYRDHPLFRPTGGV